MALGRKIAYKLSHLYMNLQLIMIQQGSQNQIEN